MNDINNQDLDIFLDDVTSSKSTTPVKPADLPKPELKIPDNKSKPKKWLKPLSIGMLCFGSVALVTGATMLGVSLSKNKTQEEKRYIYFASTLHCDLYGDVFISVPSNTTWYDLVKKLNKVPNVSPKEGYSISKHSSLNPQTGQTDVIDLWIDKNGMPIKYDTEITDNFVAFPQVELTNLQIEKWVEPTNTDHCLYDSTTITTADKVVPYGTKWKDVKKPTVIFEEGYCLSSWAYLDESTTPVSLIPIDDEYIIKKPNLKFKPIATKITCNIYFTSDSHSILNQPLFMLEKDYNTDLNSIQDEFPDDYSIEDGYEKDGWYLNDVKIDHQINIKKDSYITLKTKPKEFNVALNETKSSNITTSEMPEKCYFQTQYVAIFELTNSATTVNSCDVYVTTSIGRVKLDQSYIEIDYQNDNLVKITLKPAAIVGDIEFVITASQE